MLDGLSPLKIVQYLGKYIFRHFHRLSFVVLNSTTTWKLTKATSNSDREWAVPVSSFWLGYYIIMFRFSNTDIIWLTSDLGWCFFSGCRGPPPQAWCDSITGSRNLQNKCKLLKTKHFQLIYKQCYVTNVVKKNGQKNNKKKNNDSKYIYFTYTVAVLFWNSRISIFLAWTEQKHNTRQYNTQLNKIK